MGKALMILALGWFGHRFFSQLHDEDVAAGNTGIGSYLIPAALVLAAAKLPQVQCGG